MQKSLILEPVKLFFSTAAGPQAQYFLWGTSWHLRAFTSNGDALWDFEAPEAVFAINVSGDGQLVVAAYSDGTIRWHRSDDGRELLALQVLADKKNWVLWTPEGFYAATPGAHGVLRWLVNRGPTRPQKRSGIGDSGLNRLRRAAVGSAGA